MRRDITFNSKGLKCGGWGKIIMEIRVEKRKKA